MEPGAGIAKRLALAAAAAVATVAMVVTLLAASGTAGAGDPAAELLPDLRVTRPHELYVSGSTDRPVLRFSHTTLNVGAGPLELSPDLDDSDNVCGELGADLFDAWQYVYRDGDESGVFERDRDGSPEGHEVGCMYFHAKHNHYHFDDFAEYTLHRAGGGKPLATSGKVSFCVYDGGEAPVRPALPGAPQAAHYQWANCNRSDGTHGISVGWADTYGAQTQGQRLRLAGLRAGQYCLIAVADPENRLRELREENNRSLVRVKLKPRQRVVKRVARPCGPKPGA